MRTADNNAAAHGAGQEPGFRFISQNSKAGPQTFLDEIALAARS